MMSDDNSRCQQHTAPAVSSGSLIQVNGQLVPDAKSTIVGTESQHAWRTAYAELTGLELMHAPWVQL
jgi:hypothetical protein